MSKKLTKEIWIERFHKTHPIGKFDYTEFVYVTSHTKGKINCLTCKRSIMQTAQRHYRHGCTHCRNIANSKKYSMGLDKFIERATAKHHERYDYSYIKEYKKTSIDVPIFCKQCNEIFWQKPMVHLRKNCVIGCPKCAKCYVDTKIFKDKIRKKWNNKFNLEKSIYVNSITPIEIICNNCLCAFWKKPEKLYKRGNCPKCETKISSKEISWLNDNNIPIECRQKSIPNTLYKVDGLVDNILR